MGLREKLNEILPTLLPERAEDAIKGKELIARVRAVLGDAYSDHSLRSQFSFIALDPDSCLARVENGQGYYLRSEGDSPSLQNVFGGNAEGETMLHKAMALAVRLYDTAGQGVFVYPVDDEESWGHPDLVAVQWPAGAWDDEGAYIMEEPGDTLSFRAICVGFVDDEESCRQAFSGHWHVASGRRKASCCCCPVQLMKKNSLILPRAMVWASAAWMPMKTHWKPCPGPMRFSV
ncbi:MAG: hypothetical protein IIV41_01980 [Akkermansia sp.]|nr:hypothetical protein [Akkermansia sp.]